MLNCQTLRAVVGAVAFRLPGSIAYVLALHVVCVKFFCHKS